MKLADGSDGSDFSAPLSNDVSVSDFPKIFPLGDLSNDFSNGFFRQIFTDVPGRFSRARPHSQDTHSTAELRFALFTVAKAWDATAMAAAVARCSQVFPGVPRC